jgi:iron complex outermembrane receptor protein
MPLLRIRTAGVLILCGVLLAPAAPACADPPAQPAQTNTPAAPSHDLADVLSLSPEQLFGATVTSVTKTPETVWNSAAAISVLTTEDIKRSGATSIPEALRLMPGVQVARVSANAWAIGIRGFNGTLDNKLLVLMDGRELYNHLFSGTYWDVQDTPLEDIERIEVIRGPGAALWGANAVNGVINIITKNAAETQGGLLSAGGGNLDRGVGAARFGGQGPDGMSYRMYAKYVDRGDDKTLMGTNAQDGMQAWHEGFRADWAPGATGNGFTLEGDTYRDFESAFRSDPKLTAPFSVTALDKASADGGNILGRWTHSFANGAQAQVQSYLDYTLRDDLVLEDRYTAFDTEAQVNFAPMGRHQVVAGASYRLSSDNITPGLVATTQHPHLTDELLSGFVQDQISLVPDRWILTLGSKFEHTDYVGFLAEPDVRLQFHPDPTHTFWAAASRADRTPSRLEHDVKVEPGVIALFGVIPVELFLGPTANFRPETLDSYQAGYRQQVTPEVTLDLTAFYNVYHGLETVLLGTGKVVSIVPLILEDPLSYGNDTSARTHGLEAEIDWQAHKDLKITASQSFLNMQLNGPPSKVAIAATAPAGQSPQSQTGLRANWDVTDRIQLDTMIYYTSALSQPQVKSYWRGDERLGWKIAPGVEASLVGQNLLEAHHREFSALSDPGAVDIGRTVFGSVTWRF